MTERSPIPPCLSHLTQRDAAVRERALEAAIYVESPDRERMERNFNDHDVRIWQRGFDAKDDAIRALLHPPPAPAPLPAAFDGYAVELTDELLHDLHGVPYDKLPPAPSEAAIRAELVAALREVMALVQGPQHIMKKPAYGDIYAVMERARAALVKAEAV